MSKRVKLTLESRDVADLVASIARAHGVSLEALQSKMRYRPVSEARAQACYELYDALGSYPAVGEVMGLDHTTAMHARKRWARIVGEVLR